MPMATAAAAAMTTPSVVRWSAVMPVLRRFSPIGRNPFSMFALKRPSSMRAPDDAVSDARR